MPISSNFRQISRENKRDCRDFPKQSLLVRKITEILRWERGRDFIESERHFSTRSQHKNASKAPFHYESGVSATAYDLDYFSYPMSIISKRILIRMLVIEIRGCHVTARG